MELEPGLNEVHCPEFSKGPECQVEEVGGVAAKEGHEQKLEVVVVSRLELEKKARVFGFPNKKNTLFW